MTNLIVNPSALDQEPWVTSGVTVSANAATDPAGNPTADSLVEDSNTSEHRIGQTVTFVPGTIYKVGAVVRQEAGRPIAYLRVKGGSIQSGPVIADITAMFDLEAGTIASITGYYGGLTAVSISSEDNGYKRIEIQFIASQPQGAPVSEANAVVSVGAAPDSITLSYLGTGVENLSVAEVYAETV